MRSGAPAKKVVISAWVHGCAAPMQTRVDTEASLSIFVAGKICVESAAACMRVAQN